VVDQSDTVYVSYTCESDTPFPSGGVLSISSNGAFNWITPIDGVDTLSFSPSWRRQQRK